MAVRTAYVGTQSPGQILTSANFTKLPGGWIGYAQVTSDQGSLTTATDLTSLTVTVTAGTSRRLKITGHASFYDSSTTGAQFRIDEDSTQIQRRDFPCPSASAGIGATVIAVAAPSAGSHVYNLKAGRGVGSAGTVTMVATATVPAFILVEDIGPSA